MIDEVKAVNRMFAILILSFIHVSFYPFSIHALIKVIQTVPMISRI
jgi:hypothetical protein